MRKNEKIALTLQKKHGKIIELVKMALLFFYKEKY